MGRKRYTPEERLRITSSFVRAAAKLIETEGVEGVSIRRVATIAGYNSATLYLYFKDLDELVTLACITYLEDYCRELSHTADQMQTPEQTYLHTWRLFSKYAFSLPEVFHHLFFSTHTVGMNETIDRYYRIYPSFLDSIDGVVNNMLHEGDLAQRNLLVLEPLAQEGIIEPEDVPLVNQLSISYFGRLLEERCRQVRESGGKVGESPEDVGTRDVEDVERLTNEFMTATHFLLVR